MGRQRGNSIVGLFLIALGIWLILGGVGVDLPNVGEIWPVILAIFGLAVLSRYAAVAPREEGLVLVGVASLLTGSFLFLFTFDVLQWRQLDEYWPVFPLIVGLSYFAVYLAGGMRNPGLLVPSFAVGTVGVAALPFTLGTVDSPLALRLIGLWPVAVVILGLAFFFRPVQQPRLRLRLGRKSKGDDGQEKGSAS